MPVAYLLLIVFSFFASRAHWPFSNIAAVLGIFVLVADFLTQVIRIAMGRIRIGTLLGSLALLLLSVAFAFTWLFWSGGMIVAYTVLAIAAGYFVYWIAGRHKATLRFFIVAIVYAIVVMITTMNPSTRLCVKNNITIGHPDAPLSIRHKLAWFLYNEGNIPAAENTLLEEQKTIADQLGSGEDIDYRTALEENAAIIQQALSDVRSRSWNNYRQLEATFY